MQEKQLISIVIPTFRRQDMLSRCLQSVTQQTSSDFEVIVVDNDKHECAEVKQIVSEFSDLPVKYIHQPVSGVSAARNKGIEKASGEWVLFVDDDDEIESNMVSELVKFIGMNHGLSFVWCGVIKLFEGVIQGETERKEFYIAQKDLDDMSFILKIGTGCGLCVRRQDLLEVGGFDEDFKLSEDRDLIIKLIKAEKEYMPVNKSLYRRYYHSGERLSQRFHALEEAEHDYKLYYEHLSFVTMYPMLRLRLLDLRARHYSEGGKPERAVEIAYHTWQIRPSRIRSIRRLIGYWLRSLFKISNSYSSVA